MRLWHYKLIPHLPRQQLLGQHRECCALRGKGWNKKHSVIDYIKKYDYKMLFHYHVLIMIEMWRRGYNIEPKWKNILYRGKQLGVINPIHIRPYNKKYYDNYPEHDDDYLLECLNNLYKKDVDLYNYFNFKEVRL